MLKHLSIQSKLMLMLLLVSLSSSTVIAFQGYRSGKKALEESIFRQLTSLRASRSEQVETYFDSLEAGIRNTSTSPFTLQATQEFRTAYDKLQSAEIPKAWDQEIDTYYTESFLPRLIENVEGEPTLGIYRPFRKASRYLQYQYIANNPKKIGEKQRLLAANDGSEYSKVHAKNHPFFKNLVEQFGFYDVFLIDPKGNIIYSVFKEVDFGTSLQEGPFSETNLAEAFRLAIKRERGGVIITDFEAYRASYGAPAAFIVSPLYTGSALAGVIAAQLPVDRLNDIMTSGGEWELEGLGKTGATYLVGDDNLVRSQSRFLIENPEGYLADIASQGSSEAKIKRIKSLSTAILLQEVNSPVVDTALSGESGTVVRKDHRGQPVLTAYGPLQINGLRWAILADIDTSEAFIPIRKFERIIIATTAALMLGVSLIALALARQFLRPINRLTEGFDAIQKGKTNIEIPVDSQDEFGHLTEAFNSTVKNINRKNKMVKAKEAENRALLATIVPEDVAKRMRQGEKNIADTFSDVTVLFANLDGFSSLADSLTPQETIGLLNEIVINFDEAAERFGVEKVKTLGSSYMAVCGLAIPRLDSCKRMVDFALEMLLRTAAFNRTHNLNLQIQIGINTGEVVAGVVGSEKFIYDIWGNTVNTSHHIHSLRDDAIQITEAVYQRVGTAYDFCPIEAQAQHQQSPKAEIKIWSLSNEISATIQPA